MAATVWTASAASGYMTDVQYLSVGNTRVMVGHYSCPSAGSNYIDTGMPILKWYEVEDADDGTYVLATNSVGGLRLYFSGIAAGATGNFFIMGY